MAIVASGQKEKISSQFKREGNPIVNDSAHLLIIANHLKDIYNQLHSHIVEAKSHRPTWKVLKTAVMDETGRREEAVVEKLMPIYTLYRTLEKLAYSEYPQVEPAPIPNLENLPQV